MQNCNVFFPFCMILIDRKDFTICNSNGPDLYLPIMKYIVLPTQYFIVIYYEGILFLLNNNLDYARRRLTWFMDYIYILTGNVAQTVPFMATTTPHHGVSREENIGVVNYQMVPRGGGGGGVLAVQGYDSNYNNNNDVNDQQRQFLNEEMGELFGSLSLQGEGTGGGEERQVPPDDRTIFLTFSKGYPISENEVRDFFTRFSLSLAL